MSTLTSFIRQWGPRVAFLRDADGNVTVAMESDMSVPKALADSWAMVNPLDRTARANIPSFRRDLKVNTTHNQFWTFDEDNILDAVNLSGKHFEKFSWDPITGEFLIINPPMQHASARGRADFDDYVRGIVLRSQKKITFRNFWPTWARKDAYSTFDMDAWEISFEAQEAAENMLKAHGARGWTFIKNVTNVSLEGMTGVHRSRW